MSSLNQHRFCETGIGSAESFVGAAKPGMSGLVQDWSYSFFERCTSEIAQERFGKRGIVGRLVAMNRIEGGLIT